MYTNFTDTNPGGKGGKFDSDNFEKDKNKREKFGDDCASQIKKHFLILCWAGVGAGFTIFGTRVPVIRGTT